MPNSQVFLSYSHKDCVWKDRLMAHLRPLEKTHLLSTWHDGELGAGVDWRQGIEAALSKARVAILLVSANFLSSDFVLRKEVPSILKRRAKEGLHVIPVIVKDCLWKEITWLSEMQVRPLYGKPLAAHRADKRDTQLTAIAAEVFRYVKSESKPARSNRAVTRAVTSRTPSPRTRGCQQRLRVAPLETNVDAFLDGTKLISTLEGFVLNSGRFLERYLEVAKLRGVHIGQVRFIVPSVDAIRSAYRSKLKSQERYLSDTVRNIKSAWEHLESQRLVESVEFRRIDCVPRNFCVIRNKDLVLTGLYESDHAHPLGLTCRKSWFHDLSPHLGELSKGYSEWFDSLWRESSLMS